MLLNKYLKTTQLLIIALFLFKNNLAQNLIQNGSFELSTNINCSTGTYTVIDNWNGIGTPDYYNAICPLNNNNVPYNRFGESFAVNNGGAYVGIVTYYKTSEYKEYVQQQLSLPLISTKSYYLSFYISRADRVNYSTNNTGAFFSVFQPTVVGNTYFPAIPQVENQIGFLTDTAGWTKIEGYFTAQGGEQYLTIGNFNSNTNTDTLNSGTTNPIPLDPGEAYYYIDSVSLYDSLDYVTNVLQIKNEIKLSIYPNPGHDKIKVQINSKNKTNLSINITDVLGREIKQLEYEEEIDMSELEKGIYFLSLYQNTHLLITKKVIKE